MQATYQNIYLLKLIHYAQDALTFSICNESIIVESPEETSMNGKLHQNFKSPCCTKEEQEYNVTKLT